ncbi:MAG: antibiotic biosynthesis monooxygenase [Solirubrobacterales bacterium]|nr:antibiotic biosynthesis monooxygenase [Solirubrobacterales bacterium]
MFAVLFEVQPKASEWDRYLELAGTLRPELVRIPGFLHNERYRSERTEGRLLSLSLWEDEKALVRWRTHGLHHEVQGKGRFEVFEDYHLRVGEVVTDSELGELPQTHLERTEAGAGTAATVIEIEPGEGAPDEPPRSADLIDVEWYRGINDEARRLLLASWRGAEPAADWLAGERHGSRRRHVRVVRDYGLHDRAEAPQYFPAVRDPAA